MNNSLVVLAGKATCYAAFMLVFRRLEKYDDNFIQKHKNVQAIRRYLKLVVLK